MKILNNLIQVIKQTTLIEWIVIISMILIMLGAVFGGERRQPGSKFNPLFNPEAAQAQAMQKQNELKERELKLMEENNQLLRDLKNK